MKRKLIVASALLVALAAFVAYFWWSSAIRQPLEFWHSQHVKARIQCVVCHKDLEGLPGTDLCKKCHTGRQYPATIEWIRVYRIAPDVIFHHSGHPNVPCGKCHGDFSSGKKWIHESRYAMNFCMKCHEETGASNACRKCHKNR